MLIFDILLLLALLCCMVLQSYFISLFVRLASFFFLPVCQTCYKKLLEWFILSKQSCSSHLVESPVFFYIAEKKEIIAMSIWNIYCTWYSCFYFTKGSVSVCVLQSCFSSRLDSTSFTWFIAQYSTHSPLHPRRLMSRSMLISWRNLVIVCHILQNTWFAPTFRPMIDPH